MDAEYELANTLHLLLVEDDPADAEIIEQILARVPDRTFRVQHLPTLGQAAAALEKGPNAEVILLDLSLVDATASEAMQFIASVGATIPIVVLTGNDDDRMVMEAARHGAQDYLVKWEFNPKLLSRSIRYAIERQQIERQLRLALELAEAASRAKNDFLAMMTHEVRTPLNAVLGMTDALSFTQLDAEQKQYLGTLNRAGRHLLHLVDDVLDLSRIESGRIELDQQAFDVRALVADPIEFLQYSRANKAIAMSHAVATDVPSELVGDAGRIRQVLVNLLGNAIKFTEQGSVQVFVTMAHHGEPHQGELGQGDPCELQFMIRDTGIGIAESQLPKLFENFTQAETSITRRYGGSGLGLAISKRLVQLMDGKIWVESNLGSGSTFFFTIKATIPTVSQRRKDRLSGGWPTRIERSAPNGAPTAPARSLSVLLVDDDEDNRMVTGLFLKHLGHEMDAVDRGELALQRVRQFRYDLILMDVHMPGMDGHAVTREIRKLEATRRQDPVPILFFTADSLTLTREKATAAGAIGLLTKPIAREQLAAAIQEVLKSSKPASEGAEAGSRESAREGVDQEIKHLLPRYVGSRRSDIEKIRACVAQQDWETISALAHKMKGSGRCYGLPLVTEIGDSMEAAAECGDRSTIAEQVDALERFLEQVERDLAHDLPSYRLM